MIQFTCEKCGILLEVDDSKAGRVGACGACGAAMIVPSPIVARSEGPSTIVSGLQRGMSSLVGVIGRSITSARSRRKEARSAYKCYRMEVQARARAATELERERLKAGVIACPDCAELISVRAEACPFCGRPMTGKARQAQASSVPLVQQTVIVDHPHARWSPLVAALLSFIIPGLGQIYKGQPLNGLVWFILVVAGYICFIIPGFVLHLCCVLGAAMGDPYR